MHPFLEEIMSTTKDKDDATTNVSNTASEIEEEEYAIVIVEHNYIVKVKDDSIKDGSIKDSNTVLAWDVDQTLKGVGMVIIFAGRSIGSLWFDIFFLNDFLIVE